MASGTRVEASRKQTNAQSVWGVCGFTVCLCRRKCRSSWFRHRPWMENINASSPHALAPQFAVYSTGRFQGICSWSESLSPPPSLPPPSEAPDRRYYLKCNRRVGFLFWPRGVLQMFAGTSTILGRGRRCGGLVARRARMIPALCECLLWGSRYKTMLEILAFIFSIQG